MASATLRYSYDPAKIAQRGRDQMRFELGDTLVGGGAESCALSDQEYMALLKGLKPGKKAWMRAKLRALRAIASKLSYQVDTKIDVLSYGFGDRAKLWQRMCDDLRRELSADSGVPSMDERARKKPPYFHAGMMENPRSDET